MSDEILWYANSATGAVCLLLFTVVVLLGIAVRLRARIPGLPRWQPPPARCWPGN